MIRVTYIGHSGFLVEWPEQYWLFDYYNGTLPPLLPSKPLLVFASHRHADHFNPAIFRLPHPDVRYILSKDIRLTERKREEYGVPVGAEILSLSRRETVNLGPLSVCTLPSTDEGVAFLLTYNGRRVYHAGDLNWWAWAGESESYNHNMEANFKRFIEPLRGVHLDLCFAPLDPRQEGDYALGLSYLLKLAQADHVFPMHLWDDYGLIETFRAAYPQLSGPVVSITHQGQSWDLT